MSDESNPALSPLLDIEPALLDAARGARILFHLSQSRSQVDEEDLGWVASKLSADLTAVKAAWRAALIAAGAAPQEIPQD